MEGLSILPAIPADVPLLMGLVRELAEYENLAHAVASDEGVLAGALFGERPYLEAVVARIGDEPAGFAAFFHSFSTFRGRPGLFVEDLFVRPAFRSRGIGRALLARLAAVAEDRGCHRMEWWVLDWNEPAMGFYRGLGAEKVPAWQPWHLVGEDLARLAAQGRTD